MKNQIRLHKTCRKSHQINQDTRLPEYLPNQYLPDLNNGPNLDYRNQRNSGAQYEWEQHLEPHKRATESLVFANADCFALQAVTRYKSFQQVPVCLTAVDQDFPSGAVRSSLIAAPLWLHHRGADRVTFLAERMELAIINMRGVEYACTCSAITKHRFVPLCINELACCYRPLLSSAPSFLAWLSARIPYNIPSSGASN